MVHDHGEFLSNKEMWQIIEDGIPLLGSPTEAQRKVVAEATLKDLKVKNYLFQAIDRKILETILDTSTSKIIWCIQLFFCFILFYMLNKVL